MPNTQLEISPVYILTPLVLAAGAVVAQRLLVRAPGWGAQRAVRVLAAVLYATAVLDATLFPIEVTWGSYANQAPWYSQVNPVPLVHALSGPSFLLNLVMFAPFGTLLPLLDRRVTAWRQVTVAALAASAMIELSQLLLYVVCRNGRTADVDDLIANTAGALLGYAGLQALRWLLPQPAQQTARQPASRPAPASPADDGLGPEG